MDQISKLYTLCRKAGASFLVVLYNYIYFLYFKKKTIFAQENVIIKKLSHITFKDRARLFIGVNVFSLALKSEKTVLIADGNIILNGDFHLGRGCKMTVGRKATVRIGKLVKINSYTQIIINNGLTIGDNCFISWSCQFLDDDFQKIDYANKVDRPKEIIIGNNVWIGNNVKIQKGVVIPDNCIVASNSVVVSTVTKQNCLIGGYPAKIIKDNVSWSPGQGSDS